MPDTTPPNSITLAWQLHTSPAATTGLSIGRIVDTAVKVADEHGLAGLSLRKLGEYLGAGTMTAYRHIRSKEDLVILMVDTAFGPPPQDMTKAADWREALRMWADGMADRYRQHSWLLDAPLPGVPMTPNRLLWLERILQTLAFTGLNTQRLLDAALLVDGHVRHIAYLRRELRRQTALPPEQSTSWLSELLPDGELPMTRQVLTSGLLGDGEDQDMRMGLDWIIAGIETSQTSLG